MRYNKIASLLMAAAIASSLMTSSFALEYDFNADKPGQSFYQATAVGTDAAADSGTIIVGADGTIGTVEANMPSSSPLSVLDIPVGEYPDAWGMATDVAIAQNTVFPNAFAPTTQWSNVPGIVAYDMNEVSSGALPTGFQENKNAIYTGGTFGWYYYGNAVYNPMGGAYYAYPATATAITKMPKYKGSAIGRLQIPSVGMNKYVYEGTGSSVLSKGVGHFSCTNGWDGNVAFAGHNRNSKNTAAFQKLKDVNYGDLVYYTTAYGVRTYQVTSIETVSVYDTSGLAQDGTFKLTMYTCQANQPDVKLKVVATLVG